MASLFNTKISDTYVGLIKTLDTTAITATLKELSDGNGNATGPTVTTGFQPNFVLIKRSDGTSNWNIYDTARDSSNPSGPPLYPNLGNAQGGSQAVNFLSTGFQPAYAGGDVNENNGNYIYMAFKHN